MYSRIDEWFVSLQAADKFLPMHMRKKTRGQLPNPLVFEILPRSGSLLADERANVQVKFMPTQEQIYSHRLAIKLSQSSQKVVINANGNGKEPELDFVESLLEFGPTLPHSLGGEKNIIVKNTTCEPIEFYSVEFDPQYMEEEKVCKN